MPNVRHSTTRPSSVLPSLKLGLIAVLASGCSWLAKNPEVPLTVAELLQDNAPQACEAFPKKSDRADCLAALALVRQVQETACAYAPPPTTKE